MIRLTAFLALLPLLAAAQPRPAVGVRVLFGLTDTVETKWDGSVSASNARVVSLEPWRFDLEDALTANNSWRASTHPIRLFGGGRQGPPPVVANGVIVWLDQDGPDVALEVQTAQGAFSARLAGLPYGTSKKLLNGRVMVDRVPPVLRLTDSADEQDFPAAATAKDGSLWVAYMEFQHHPDHNKLRANLLEAPDNFRAYATPTGGDRIWLRRYQNGSWGEPVPVAGPADDLYRPAIAVDGSNRPWVFWPEARQGTGFDLAARYLAAGRLSNVVRIAATQGNDMDPVAATDSSGRVWVAWQGWRNGRAAIFAASQNADRFSAPVAVSNSTANEWNPAIAADSSGRVTVAWDSYRNGNYDVYLRTADGAGAWGRETPLAASANYEAYPSLAYDPSGRLWAAYEEGGERWGKDFGAYDTEGIALYRSRAVRLLVVGKGGEIQRPAVDPGTVLPGVPSRQADDMGRQSETSGWQKPKPQLVESRRPSATPVASEGPKNSMPRVHVDASGRVWLAVRSAHPIWWNPIGTVWTEHVISYDGKQWTGPIFLTHSDNLLDNRPALASLKAGELMAVGSSDGRRHFQQITAQARPRRAARDGNVVVDPFHNDVWVNTVSLGPAAAPPALAPAPAVAVAVAAPTAADKTEAAIIQQMRQYRLKTKSGTLRILRGEFHRHSEVSMDGGGDGSILDQWRYALDAANMDWVGCCDHDNGAGREYSWWMTQKQTDLFYSPGVFVPMFSYERSVSYPEGHRNVIFAQRGIRTLPRLPLSSPDAPGKAPDTQMLYRYLREHNGVVAVHTSGTNMGTDWRDNDTEVEPMVEIYQGDRQNYEMPGAPRANTEQDSIGGWRPKGFINLALEMGYKLAFQASSDHISTHMSYANILVAEPTRQALLDALKKRHVYGATENILAEFTTGEYIMGDAFQAASAPQFQVKLTGTAPFAKVHVIKDNQYVYTIEPRKAAVAFTWRDSQPAAGKTSYYYVRGEQTDGEVVWVSPMWVTYTK